MKLHEDGEEELLFPLLAEKAPHVVGPYIFDHRHHSSTYTEIIELLTGIQKSTSSSEQRKASARLNRLGIAANAVMDVHINKENEVLLPVFD